MPGGRPFCVVVSLLLGMFFAALDVVVGALSEKGSFAFVRV